MSVRGGVGTRLFVVGGQEVRSEFDRTGQHAQRMWSEIGSGQRTASPALRAVSSAAEEARGAVEGMASSAGGLGRALGVLGPAGIAAGAALGGLVLAIQNSRATAQWADDLATAADKIGVTAEKLQELRHAGEVFEVSMADLDRGLQKLNASLGAMRTGVGDGRLKDAFAELGISREQLQNLESADQLLPLLADKFSQLGSRADQTQLAKKLQIEELLPLLVQGSDKIAEMTQKARDLGLVMDEASVQGAAALNEELRVADERLGAAARQMDTAMIPALVAMKGALADAAQAAADLFNWMNRNSVNNADWQIQQRLRTAQASRERARTLRDEDASYADVLATGAVSGVEAMSRERRLAAARRQEALAIAAESEIEAISLREQARLKALEDDARRRTAGGGGSSGDSPPARSGGSGRASSSPGVTVTPFDTVLPIDPVTRRPIQPKTQLEREIERLYGPEVKDGVKLPVKVDLKPSLDENLARYQEAFRERTQSAFADGLRAAMDGNLGQFLAARLRDYLVESVAPSLAEAMTQATAGRTLTGGGGIGDIILSLFSRRASGGPVQAGRGYSLAEYGPEIAVFGQNGQVFDTASTLRMLTQAAGASASASANIQVVVNIDAKDAVLSETVRGWISEGVAKGMSEAVEASGHEAGPRAFDWMSRNRILREP